MSDAKLVEEACGKNLLEFRHARRRKFKPTKWLKSVCSVDEMHFRVIGLQAEQREQVYEEQIRALTSNLENVHRNITSV